jgi:hypothetical protein
MSMQITLQEARQLAIDAYAKMELIDKYYEPDEDNLWLEGSIGDACCAIRDCICSLELDDGEG